MTVFVHWEWPRSPDGVLVKRWLGAVGATCVMIVVLYGVADRPAATWAHAAFGIAGGAGRLKPLFVALTHIVDPVPPAAALGMLVSGIVAAVARRPVAGIRGAFAISVATMASIAMKDQLKYAFGRSWPETWVDGNQSWIGSGAYGFTPFHGGPGWTSFPSGHMTIMTAPMVMLMIVKPSWRAVWVIPIALVAVGLYGADYHFLSDIVAGVLVGAISAALVWVVMTPDAGGSAS